MGGGNNDKAKEILQIFQEVKKAADRASALSGGADESRCLDALKQLKDFPVTSQILVSTMVHLFNLCIRMFAPFFECIAKSVNLCV